jgi:Flp pilus assembly protein TadD
MTSRIRTIRSLAPFAGLAKRAGLVASVLALAGAVSMACGDTPPVNYPLGGKDAGPGSAVTDNGGAQVGVMDGAGTSGLSGTAKDAYDRGFKAWMEGDFEGAKKGFSEAANADPKAASPHYSLGVMLERLGDLSGAQAEYRTAFTLKPDHEIAMGAYALCLAAAGHVGEADGFLTEKKAKSPESARITTYLAEIKSIQKDHGTAQQLAQDALRMNPDHKEAMVTIARDHYRARKMELAKYALTAILEGFNQGTPQATPPRDKDNAEAHLIRGLISRENGRRAAALADFEAAYAKRPDMVESAIQLGAIKLEAGNAADALPVLERAVKIAPKSAPAHLNLGDGYRLLGRSADAKRELEQALALDSTLAIAHYNLGLLYLVAPSVPGFNAVDQAGQSIKEFETYKTMRGAKTEKGDDVDDLLNRAKAKQAEVKQASAPPPAAPAAPAAGDAGAASGDAGK